MTDPNPFIQLAEGLLIQVERHQETLLQMQRELSAQSTTLEGILAGLSDLEQDGTPPPLNGEERQFESQAGAAATQAAADDRRSLPRRKGNPITVLIACEDPGEPPFEGMVLDRSPEGLCLLSDREIPSGTFLKISPVHDFPCPDWFPIEVRSCRSELQIWILGCRFEHKLPWDKMRLFG